MNIFERMPTAKKEKGEDDIKKEMEEERLKYGSSLLRLTAVENPWEKTKRADATYHNEYWQSLREKMAENLSQEILDAVMQDTRCSELLGADEERKAGLEGLIRNLAKVETNNLLSDMFATKTETKDLARFLEGEGKFLSSEHLCETMEKDMIIRKKLIILGIRSVFNNDYNPEAFMTEKKMQSYVGNEAPGLFDKNNSERLKNIPYYISLYLKGQAAAHYSKLELGVNTPALGEIADEMTDLVSGRYDLIEGKENESFQKGHSEVDIKNWVFNRFKIQEQMDNLFGKSSSPALHRSDIMQKMLEAKEYNIKY